MEYMKVTQAAEQWGISDRRVRILCQQGKIEGVIQKGRSYLIPCDAVKPIDGVPSVIKQYRNNICRCFPALTA